eukprot:9293214-Alexandrium_andersonii.AAC.1
MRFLPAAAPKAAWGAYLVGRPPHPKEVTSYKAALRLALWGRGTTRVCPALSEALIERPQESLKLWSILRAV